MNSTELLNPQNIPGISTSVNLENYTTEVVDCSNMKQLFELLNSSTAEHMAILSEQESEISNLFEYVESAFSRSEVVSLALFYPKNCH